MKPRTSTPSKRRPWLLPVAACLSVACHLAFVAPFLLRARPQAADPADTGTVELLMVEEKGAQPAQAAPPPQPPQPQPQPKPPDRQVRPDKPQAAPAAALPPGDEPGPALARADPAPKPPAPAPPDPAPPAPAPPDPAPPDPAPPDPPPPDRPTPQAQKPTPPAPQQAPVFNLAGTDSDSNARVIGDHVLPASVDDKFRNRPPRFPDDAAIRGERGMVVLVIHVNAQGLPEAIDVAESSGYADLDRAALDAVRKWRFHPAMRDGKTVPFDLPFRFDFE